jgi:hypothetical protein
MIIVCVQGFSQPIHHQIKAVINVPDKYMEVEDSVKFPGTYFTGNRDGIHFTLNANFTVKLLNTEVKLQEVTMQSHDTTGAKVKKYVVDYGIGSLKNGMLVLQYKGKITGEIKEGAVEYARGFSETSGIISNDGIYLAGSTAWVPSFNDEFFTFDLTTVMDSAWGVVSQGTRTKNMVSGNKRTIQYSFTDPADEVYLVAAPWTEYSKMSGKVLIQAELRKPDTALANRYINATADYLALYEKLIGPYPYSKFTLVENFWETGYGMPSFTLLGEKIIRFPFIITTSYPHELLHNYWGNSVYVDYSKGNWCEGITAYMADHLFKEQQGQGAEYRRTTLGKFTDFVNETNDFPVNKFQARNNSAEEAIGYGKALMIFEMLRYDMGDDVFRKAFSAFYQKNIFKKASWDDIMIAFENASMKSLKPFFDQWLKRIGAPTLKLSNVIVTPADKKYDISFTLSQIQKEEPFTVKIPVVVYDEEKVTVKDFTMTQREEKFIISCDKAPVRIDIDPQFNVMRRLDKEEVPVSISQIMGDKDVVMILPKSSPLIKEYTDLAEQWKKTQEVQGCKFEIKYDADLQELPDKASWIVGFDNKFASTLNVFNNYAGYIPKETIAKTDSLKQSGGLVYVYQNPKNKNITNGFLGSTNQKMIDGLKRKVVHYGKYSYLGFEGDDAVNKLKGEFPALSSPLSYYIKYNGKVLTTAAKLKPRKALMY